MNLGDLHKVWEIKSLKRKPGEEEAKKILEKIAKQVQPIWRVKLLLEFCLYNPALLGLNMGAGNHVKLRLRRPNRDWDFYPFDQVLDTMLHKLCYNAYGPHKSSFYKLWDELRKMLMATTMSFHLMESFHKCALQNRHCALETPLMLNADAYGNNDVISLDGELPQVCPPKSPL